MTEFAPYQQDASLAQEIAQTAPVQVTSQVTTSPVGSAQAAYLLKNPLQWTWEDLRDYVVTEAEKRFGPQIRNPAKEGGIFRAFITRHGIFDAALVAMSAFEVYGGTWRSAPVTVTRFTKNNDPFFAEIILARSKG